MRLRGKRRDRDRWYWCVVYYEMLRAVDMRDRAWYWVDGGGDTTWIADWILDSIQIHKWKGVRGLWFIRPGCVDDARIPIISVAQSTELTRMRAPAQAQEVGSWVVRK